MPHCRFDLLRSINNLARKITKWTKKEDALLHHLMAYVHQSKHHMMIGWVGDSLGDSSIGLFADADYAGCRLWRELEINLLCSPAHSRSAYKISVGGTQRKAGVLKSLHT